jgi:acetylornithine/succinyldiaminopimelate/putrescine aminotransferase
MNTYNRQNVRFARGDGIWLWDDHFQKYMDAISGIAVTNLGHSNPNISAAISQQASRVMHTSNLYHKSKILLTYLCLVVIFEYKYLLYSNYVNIINKSTGTIHRT